eukprot:26949_1
MNHQLRRTGSSTRADSPPILSASHMRPQGQRVAQPQTLSGGFDPNYNQRFSQQPFRPYGMAPGPGMPNAGIGGAPAMFAQQQPSSPSVHLAQTMTLTNADREKFDRLFRLLDTEKKGVLPGSIIFPVFTSSKLPKQKLSEIWGISNSGASHGGLSHEDFYVGLRLISIAQKGYPVTRESVARISDIDLPP